MMINHTTSKPRCCMSRISLYICLLITPILGQMVVLRRVSQQSFRGCITSNKRTLKAPDANDLTRSSIFCSRSRRRQLSSWTRNDIASPGGKTITLELKQQFMVPPGGATTDSTGRHIWPTAIPLLQHMLQTTQEQSKGIFGDTSTTTTKTVLELGSGCGLLGMGLVAASMPPTSFSSSTTLYQVVMTDHSTEWLQQNLERNQEILFGGSNVETQQQQHQNIEIHRLQWGNEQDLASLYETSAILHQYSKHRKQFDYIIGSDILYNPASHEALVSTLKFFSSSSNKKSNTITQTLLAYPKRQSDEAQFVSLAESNGFLVRTEPLVMEDHDLARTGKEYALATLEYVGS